MQEWVEPVLEAVHPPILAVLRGVFEETWRIVRRPLTPKKNTHTAPRH